MAGIFNLVTKLFGNKYDKDIKSIEPIIKQIHTEHEKITTISNDELRSKTIELSVSCVSCCGFIIILSIKSVCKPVT